MQYSIINALLGFLKMNSVYFTICAKNYLSYAQVLGKSIEKSMPGSRFIVFLIDAPIAPETEIELEIITLAEISIPNADEMTFKYNVLELSTSIKPHCFIHIFEKLGCKSAIYMDPDIEVFSPLTEAERELSGGATCVLTPHIMKPLEDDFKPSEIDILNSGTFNLGFVGFTESRETNNFLRWWARKLESHCFVDLSKGLFVDQKFMDFAPSFLEKLKIIRNPSYNVAYWNLEHRLLERNGSQYTVNGKPLAFFHFSGVVPNDPSIVSKHQNRFTASNNTEFEQLIRTYIKKLYANDFKIWNSTPYSFGQFDNGDIVLNEFRRGPPKNPTRPFEAPNLEYWTAPSSKYHFEPNFTFTRFMETVFDSREDLQQSFPLGKATGRAGFLLWLRGYLKPHTELYQALSSTTPKTNNSGLLARVWLSLGRRMGLI